MNTRTSRARKVTNRSYLGVKLTNYIDVQWVKSCMIKGTIESQSAKNYEVNVERYLKTMADRIRVELARQRKN
jgi:uncharacterized membrane protein